ncbi:type 1 glutamine amidotransferase domain-containing protein [Bacillus testis]|uniref:type 1 glutamine amidotransferase domain-containing protein n=1 Tax=Bacillus testis TaxID=1622072 RepID=UPI00067EAA39|nr:type 1 glutamine amidotransferase domain-containing protein [Bacillus testis]
MKKILFAVTSHPTLTPDHPTGVYLEEFAIPYERFKREGYELEVVSPKGGITPIDPASLNISDQQKEDWKDSFQALEQAKPINGMIADHFDALYFPGGHGAMLDLPETTEVAELLMDFVEQDKIVAAVCHGPAAFVQAKYADGTPFVSGKQITGFTNEEEKEMGLTETVPFLLESKLKELGAHFIATPNWQSHVQCDGKLITGQNPQSSAALAEKIIQKLKSKATVK